MLHLILLAAGYASRYGKNKLLDPVRGLPMIRHTLDPLLAYCRKDPDAADLLIVTQYPEICRIAEEEKADLVINPDPSRGISSSILAGFAELNRNDRIKEGDHLVFFTGDMPDLKRETIFGFLDHVKKENPPLSAMASKGRYGIPAAFSTPYLPEFLSLSGDSGGKRILSMHEDVLDRYEVPEEELLDKDLP